MEIYVSERLGKSVCVCVFLDFRVVIIKKGEIVEASFMLGLELPAGRGCVGVEF